MANESLVHADIFFFVSTMALVVISIGIGIALFYAIRILRTVRDIAEKVQEESEQAISDLRKLRHELRDEGMKWKHVADLTRHFFMRKGGKAKKIVDKIIR
jgi:predicted RNase H-related nuclease YkuK (DUF458 family)